MLSEEESISTEEPETSKAVSKNIDNITNQYFEGKNLGKRGKF